MKRKYIKKYPRLRKEIAEIVSDAYDTGFFHARNAYAPDYPKRRVNVGSKKNVDELLELFKKKQERINVKEEKN
jgi:hypothetical protein